MLKDTYYFPHDYHARHDTKIEAMVNDYGVEGYGMYWVLIERLYESRDNRIEKFPKLFFGLATELCVSPDRAEKFVLSLINDYRLLEEDETHIWSDSVLRRMEVREQQRLIKVNSGRLGGIHSGITRKGKQNEAPLQEIEANEAKERKRKERKIKESKVYSIPPTLEELTNYCKERNNKVDPNKFLNHYQAKGWLIGRNKMKDWKAAVRTWEQTKEHAPVVIKKKPARLQVLEMIALKIDRDTIKTTLLADGYPEAELDEALGRT